MRNLVKPTGLGDGEWAAIQEAEDRLVRAHAASDAPLVVGSAKELCEAIAKVVIAERGAITSGDDLPDLITSAHKLLAFQPGEGVANDPDTRQLAQGLKSIVLGVSGMRNRLGTGHGRAAPSGVTEEHKELAFEAAQLWAKWALRRLEPYIAGSVTALVRDLEGETFRRGDLAKRLKFANLPRLTDGDQRKLGIAVARRAAGGTFNVAKEGIEAVRPEDSTTWPAVYVEGLVTGLFFHPNGFLDLNAWRVAESARLISTQADPLPTLRRLAERVRMAVSSNRVGTDEEVLRRVGEVLHSSANDAQDTEQRTLWQEIASVLARSEGKGD